LNRARNIRTCLSLLLEFNPAIRLSDIDLKWYKKLLEYMHNERGYTHNTIATNVKIIKVFIEWCRDTGIYAYDDKLASQMKQSFVTRDIMYHPIEELRRMMNADLSQHPHLTGTRDRYLLQCFTGLRVSDLMSADWQIGADYLKKVPVKTRKFGEVLTVPLRPEAKELVARILSKGEMRHISDQKYNEAIKQLGKVCGIDNDHTIVRGRRQFLAGARIKKYQFMTSHMARATFICQMIEAGVSERIIMKMTGIRNSRTLDHYAEVVDTTLTEVMNEVVKKQSKV
jgi:integrase